MAFGCSYVSKHKKRAPKEQRETAQSERSVWSQKRMKWEGQLLDLSIHLTDKQVIAQSCNHIRINRNPALMVNSIVHNGENSMLTTILTTKITINFIYFNNDNKVNNVPIEFVPRFD